MAKKSAKSKGYRKQSAKKPYLTKRDIGILCAIVAALAVGAFFLFRYDDGALKLRDGAVVTEGDNWLIVNGSNVRGGARYYKLGEMGDIDGYAMENGSAIDSNVPEYTFTPAGEDDGTYMSVSCGHASAKVMASYTRSTLDSLNSAELGELQTAELAGRTVEYYFYSQGPAAEDGEAAATADKEGAEAAPEESAETAPEGAEEADEAPEEDAARPYSRSIAGYVDAAHDSCVMLHAQSSAASADELLSDEALTALLEKVLQAVAFEEAKQ